MNNNPKCMHLELVLVSGEMMDEHRSWPVEPKDPDAPYVLQFLVNEDVSLKQALKDAAVEYLRSEAGQGTYQGRNDDASAELDGESYEPFSILELWLRVPDGILEKHGLQRLKENQGSVIVHDMCVDEPVAKYADAWPGYQSKFEKARDGEG